MTGEVIKSFLVGLGFGVDDASLAKFNKAITSATLKVTALYATVKLAAAGIVAGIAKVSEGFEQMGYEYRIISPMINKTLMLRRELLKAYSAAGINIVKVIQSSVKLNFSLAKTKFAFEALYRSVASRFFDTITKQSDKFRATIYKNMPKIQAALEKFVNFVFKALEATIQLGSRVWSILSRVFDFFVKLHQSTDGWSTIILAAVAAWNLLNLSFLATPLGMLITGLVAILTLLDDFLVWEEGGKSLFDWSSFVPVIESVKMALGGLWEVLKAVADAVGNVILALHQLLTGDFSGAWDSLGDSGQRILDIFTNLWTTIKGIGSSILALGDWGSKLFSGNAAANIENMPKGVPQAAPLGSNVQNQSSTIELNQKTSIYTQPGADAQSIGKVSSSETKQNFDKVRNMKGATR